MSLIAGVLAFTQGAVEISTDAPDSFNGGTPTLNDGSLCTIAGPGTPDVWVAGIGYDSAGRIYVDTFSAPGAWVGGLPVTSDGRLCVRGTGTIDGHVAGIPISGGYVRVYAPDPGQPWNVLASDGTTYVVNNPVLSSDGTSYVVGNSVLSSNGTAYTPV